MAKRILLPLDAAVPAEATVDAVAAQARAAGATVRLLHVAPRTDNVVDDDGHVLAYSDQETARVEAETIDYLHAAAIPLDGVAVEYGVRFGDPVTCILDEADQWGADLIAMATRGRSCIGRALLGSVAEQVFRRATTAVTLFRAGRDRTA